MTPFRRLVALGLAALTSAALTTAPAVASPTPPPPIGSSGAPAAGVPLGAVPAGIPSSCWSNVSTLMPNSTRIGWLVMANGDDYVVDYGANNSLGFTPKAMVTYSEESISDTRWRVRGHAVRSNGDLYYFAQTYTWSPSTDRVSVKVTKRVVAHGWKDTRGLAGSFSSQRRVLYRLHGSALRRYDLTTAGVVTKGTSVARTGWAWTRTISLYDSNPWADVLASTRRTGQLHSTRISKKVPATGSSQYVLAEKGFDNFRALSTGHCANGGLLFLGVRTTGGAGAYYDSNGRDNTASLVGGWVKGSNWPFRVYSS